MYVSGIIRFQNYFRKLLHITYETIYSRRKKWFKLSKHYAINQVERMNIYSMYKLLCIIYNDHHLMHCAFCYVKFCKSWLFKYHGDIAKTGDKSSTLPFSVRCRFQSNTFTKVVKASTWKLLYMILMKIKCAWHLFSEVSKHSPMHITH